MAVLCEEVSEQIILSRTSYSPGLGEACLGRGTFSLLRHSDAHHDACGCAAAAGSLIVCPQALVTGSEVFRIFHPAARLIGLMQHKVAALRG